MMGVMRGYGGYAGGPTAGSWGENFAGRLANAGQMGMGLAGAGMAGLGVASSLGLVGGPLGMIGAMADPFGMALRAGGGAFSMAGGGLGGLAAGGLAAGAVALPLYAGAQWAGGMARNFMGGMQDQMGLNSVLRQNFNFLGGQGAFGRGFSQQQMGQIGGMVGQELRSNVFTNAGELNQVIAGGAQMGSFTGVRDVQEFGRRFRDMLTTLRTVQRELGGNLTEAMEFINQSRQAGIFGSTQATRFAASVRNVSASTGFDQAQLMQIASQGAQIARSVGGNGRQGAFGALRGISTVSTALQGGLISEGMLSEATGGLTGQDAMQAFVSDMMQNSARFSRTAAGRYSIFGLSNRDGTGLDRGALLDFVSGDMGAGALSRRAHRSVGQMGRAQAINREGLLRGALMEEGGMAGQLGMMRMMIGDRAMDQGDDLVSLVMQRRLHMSRPQAEIMTSLMRNQGQIAATEASDAVATSRESALRGDIRERRSVDAFMRHLEHSVQDSTGMLAARDMGRSFVSRISSIAERTLNDLLGISSDQMTTEGQRSMGRLRQGRATSADLSALGFGRGGFVGGTQAFNIDSRGLLESGPGVGERLRARGMSTSGIDTFSEASQALMRAQLADAGVVSGADARALRGMSADVSGTSSRLLMARLAAQGTGNADDVFRFMGGNGNATAAFMAQHGIHNDARADGMGRLMGRGNSGTLTAGMFGRDALRLLGVGAAGVLGGGAGAALGMGAFLGGGPDFMRSEVMQAVRDPQADALDFLARGGHVGARLGRRAEREYFSGGRRDRLSEQERGLQEAISGLTREDMQGLQGNGEFMSRLRAATEAGTPEDRAAAMQRLTAFANAQEGGTSQFRAMGSVIAQMQDGLSRHGQFGSEIRSLAADPAAMRAAQQQVQEYSASMQQIGKRGGGRAGRMFEALGRTAATGDRDAMLSMQRRFRTGILGLSDDEYRRFASRAMDIDPNLPEAERERLQAEGRAAILGTSHMRAIDRDLRGEGRRRGRGAAETALGEMTGYSVGSMEFEIGGRSVSGQRAQSILQSALSGRGISGRARGDVLRQFREQVMDPEGLGLNETQTREMMTILGSSMEHRDRRTGAFTDEDRERMASFTGRRDIQDAMQEAAQRRTAAALSTAQSRDPVGARQIQVLESIETVLRTRLPENPGGGATPNGNT